MPTFNNIDGEESATVTFRVGTVQIARGTTNEEQEILILGDPDTSNALTAVTNAAPASTRWGANVRIVSGPSSVADFAVRAVLPSTYGDHGLRILQSTATDLLAAIQPIAGSTFATRPLQSSAADLQMTATPVAGSTWNVRPLQSSAADLQVTVTPVAGSTWSVRPLQSSYSDLNGLMRLADRDLSTNIAAILNGLPASTVYALAVREVGGGGSTQVAISSGIVQVQPISSSGVSLSTDTDPASTRQGLIVRQVGYSTTVNVSSLAGAVIVRSSAADFAASVQPVAGSTWAVRPLQSSAADLQMTATQQTTSWSVLARNTTSSGGGVEGSTANPVAGVMGLHVRQAFSTMGSTTILALIQTAGGTTEVASSVAGMSHKVYALSVTSTHVAVSSVAFFSSGALEIWGIEVGSQSSGVTGANLACSPPGWLCKTAQANALTFGASATGLYRICASWITEP